MLVIISFIWFYSDRTRYDRIVSDKVGTIYGRTVTNTEYERILRQLQTAQELGLTNIIQPDLTGGRDASEAVANHLIMRHRAEEMGILPSDDEVAAAEQKLPVFAGANNAFDPNKYSQFVADKLSPRGFTESQLEELVRANLQFGKLRAMLDAGVVMSPTEMRTAYTQEYAKTDASVVRFKTADYAAAINPTDDEIKKYFDDQKDKFQAPEKRRVQYVIFGLDDAQKKLMGKPRMDALKPQADAAAAFLEKLLDAKGKADFAAVAKDAGVVVKETPDFEETQNAGYPEASISGFALSAFRLTEKDPDSDVPLEVPSGRAPDSYYVLHLSNVTPARPLTLDEAKTKVVAAIKDERARTALSAKAEEIRTKIADALKAGRSIGEAAKDAGTTAQDVPDFSMAEPDYGSTADAPTIAETSLDLANGELSKFVPTTDGGLLVYVRGRKPVDEAKFNQIKDMLANSLETQKKRFFFYEWLHASRDAAGVQMAPNVRGQARGEDS